MDWSGNFRLPFANSRPSDTSFSYPYNYNYDQFPVLEMKQTSSIQATTQQTMLPTLMDKNLNYVHDPKKKRLSNEQLEMLENSFQEEIKLDPDRKMKLAKELGLQPRQIAVWFQNRRARWKSKQLERLYDALKQEYDAVSRDKHKLQEEVLALRAILKEKVGRKQVSTEISGEETVESTSIPNSSEKPKLNPTVTNNQQQLQQFADQCHNYGLMNVDDGFNNNNNSNNNQVIMPPVPFWPHCPQI